MPRRPAVDYSSRALEKPIHRPETHEMLEPAMLVGLGAVALWGHCRFPSRRPGSLGRAAVHVVLSFAAFALLPKVFGILSPLVPPDAARVDLALTLLFPTLTYVLLSWVWLIARILHDLLGGTPRGGHPAHSRS
jgi:hypothetical protein